MNAIHFGSASPVSGYNAFDPRRPMGKWGDAETDRTLHNLALKESDLVRTLSKLPENTDLYREKKNKLEEMVRQR